MSVRRHRIHRQVLEVVGCAEADAADLQRRFRQVFYARLLPVMERECAAAATADGLQRIDRLEIDLGPVASESFELAIADAFEARFGERLIAALETPAPGEASSALLELLILFCSTGVLPWWADRSDRDVLGRTIAALMHESPEALRGLIHALIDDPSAATARRRLVVSLTSRQLAALVAWLPPTSVVSSDALLDALTWLVGAARQTGADPAVVRRTWWESALTVAGRPGAVGPDAEGFLGDVAAPVVRMLGVDPASEIAPTHARTRPRATARPRAGAPADAFAARARARVASGRAQPTWFRRLMGALSADPGREGDVRPVAASASATDQRMLPAGSARLSAQGLGLKDGGTREDRAAGFPVEGGPDADAPHPPQSSSRPPGEPVGRFDRSIAQAASVDDGRSIPTGRRRRVEQGAFGRVDPTVGVDGIPVDNAGLVILWPFLARFFDQFGLLDGRSFRDPAARQRAVGLLQYVGTEDAEPPEYLLALNKVLCGMPLDDVFDGNAPPTVTDVERCEQMLTAAIHQAPILREMSVEGFRATFLQREGQLRTRDGHWLLRVARETHDIVLERFPWSFGIVKLPWMSALLHVEWL